MAFALQKPKLCSTKLILTAGNEEKFKNWDIHTYIDIEFVWCVYKSHFSIIASF